jgi:hypothetical protein
MAGIIETGKKIGTTIFNKTLGRLTGAGLPAGAEANNKLRSNASWSVRDKAADQRIKVILPPGSIIYEKFFGVPQQNAIQVDPGDPAGSFNASTNNILAPLANEGGVIFPLTPSVIISHTANYNPMTATHSNYPFYAYQNSELPSFTLVGEFPVQNQTDAQYWIAMLHFFRSATKMFFGDSVDDTGKTDGMRGNPPPILQLNGYGNYVFNKVPVVVTNFTVDLRNDVDYICTEQQTDRRGLLPTSSTVVDPSSNKSWAPTLSQVTLQLQPVYSRESVKKFNMKDFVNGNLNGNNGSGIGYI